jgi:preprotein translocase subunit SecA
MMSADDLSDIVRNIREDVVNDVITEYIPPGSLDEQWDLDGLQEAIGNEFGLDMPVKQWMEEDHDLNETGLRDRILDTMLEDYAAKEQMVGADGMRQYEKFILLQVLDRLWKEHLAAMDYLRKSIGLRGYAQKNPKQEYKRESFNMFTELLDRIKHEAVSILSKVQIRARDEVDELEQQGHSQPQNVSYQHQEVAGMQDAAEAEAGAGDVAAEAPRGEPQKPYVRTERKLGRNEPCWCGSGKKFKHCHGKLD